MNYLLITAASLCFALGILHSVLGERTILGPLFERGQLPKLFGSEEFTQQTLRFTWHVTTVLLWGLAGILGLLAAGSPGRLLPVMCWMFAVCAAVTLVQTRGKHFSWVVFAVIAVLIWGGGG